MEQINQTYISLTNQPSDINEHLPVLFKYAKECESIIETGVRGCVSSWAFVFGLLCNEKNKKKILLNDITECQINTLLEAANSTNVEIKYEWKNNLELQLEENYDLIFIDTWHVYGQLKRELNKFAPYINKYIILHDTTVDEIYGETIRAGYNAQQQSIDSGIPLEEINCGLGRAVSEFLELNSDWVILEKLTNNNGLTVLKNIKQM
jgi:cephalosporin hydroxylase